MRRAFTPLLFLLLAGCQPSAEIPRTPIIPPSPQIVACCDSPAPIPSWADYTLERLTMDEKIGQLLMVAVYSNRDHAYETEVEALCLRYHLGGVIFFQGTAEREAAFTSRLQQAADLPLLIGIDGERGLGFRLKGIPSFPRQKALGALPDSLIHRYGTAMGRQCRQLGIHINFAPVVDVATRADNPIGDRSFGDDPETVLRQAYALASGMEAEGVLYVLKHFPGHGDTEADSHLELPLLNHTRERLDSVELRPFKALIQKGAPGVMVGHLNVPALKSHGAASLSHEVVTDLLRKEMGFKGLIFTDAMNMKGVTLPAGEAEVQAFLAGNDILLYPGDIPTAVSALKRAVKSGRISRERLDCSVRRILQAKEELVLPRFVEESCIDTLGLTQTINYQSDSIIHSK